MWVIFINKEDKEEVHYVKINSSTIIVFDKQKIKFYNSENYMCYFNYEDWYIDTTFCDDVEVNDNYELKFFTEILSRICNKFKEVTTYD